MLRSKAERPLEIVSYNLMEYLRMKTNNPKLCKTDFSSRQRELFESKVREYYEKGKFCENPFEDKERLLMIFLEED